MVCKNILLAEGQDDGHVIRHLLDHHGIPCTIADPYRYGGADIVIHAAGSWRKVRGYLDIVADDGDLGCIGVVVDADTDLNARWASLSDLLARHGADRIPSRPDPTGTTMTLNQVGRSLPVGVWIMPDNTLPGILEDFAAFLIPNSDDALWRHAVECVDAIPEDLRHFPKVALPKARIHTWLAWQERPGTRMGTAVTARYLDANAAHALRLVDWVRRLFKLKSGTGVP